MPNPESVPKNQLNKTLLSGSPEHRAELNGWSTPPQIRPKALMSHLKIFRGVLDGGYKLTNDEDGTVFASWKVGGQDFYIYAKQTSPNNKPKRGKK